MNEANGTELLKEYCQEAHKRYGYGADKTIETVAFNQRVLKFRSPQYQPMMADVVTYSVAEEQQDPQQHRKYWHMMEGQRPDAVWYLDPLNKEETEFELREHVYYVGN